MGNFSNKIKLVSTQCCVPDYATLTSSQFFFFFFFNERPNTIHLGINDTAKPKRKEEVLESLHIYISETVVQNWCS